MLPIDISIFREVHFMAETGEFRTVMRGFHKQDVLQYVDTLRQEHAIELDTCKKKLESLRAEQETFARREAECAELRRQVEELTQKNEEAQSAAAENAARLSQLEAEQNVSDAVKQQLAELTDRLAAAEQEKQEAIRGLAEERRAFAEQLLTAESDTKAAKSQMAEWQSRAEQAEAIGEKYAALVGDVGSFLVEMRSMGQGYMEAAAKRSDDNIGVVEAAVQALEARAAECRAMLDAAKRDLAEQNGVLQQRLDQLTEQMETTMREITSDGEQPDAWETERYYL